MVLGDTQYFRRSRWRAGNSPMFLFKITAFQNFCNIVKDGSFFFQALYINSTNFSRAVCPLLHAKQNFTRRRNSTIRPLLDMEVLRQLFFLFLAFTFIREKQHSKKNHVQVSAESGEKISVKCIDGGAWKNIHTNVAGTFLHDEVSTHAKCSPLVLRVSFGVGLSFSRSNTTYAYCL